jgi:hypothetical protein
MQKNENDLRRERETDAKVGVVKDARRIADGDVKGTLRDSWDEMKADFDAIDDKVADAIDDDRGNR